MPGMIVIALIIVFLIIFAIVLQRKMVVLEETVNNAMSQIGNHLSSRFDALLAVLDIVNGYAKRESMALQDMVYASRSMITSRSTPDDVIYQESVIRDATKRIYIIAQQNEELKADPSFQKAMYLLETYETMMRTSRMIYNDRVSKLNQEMYLFPKSWMASILGYQKHRYL